MKKLLIVVFIGLLSLTSCWTDKEKTDNPKTRIPKTDIKPVKVNEPTKIEISTWTTDINGSWITVNSGWELSDSWSEEALEEIDKIIEEISNEK